MTNYSLLCKRVTWDFVIAAVAVPVSQIFIFNGIYWKEALASLIVIFFYNFGGWFIRLKSLGNPIDKFFTKFFIFNALKFFLLLLFISISFKYSILLPQVFTYALLVNLIIVSMSDLWKIKLLLN